MGCDDIDHEVEDVRDMGSYFIGINTLKQFLFGVGYCDGSWSISFACFSVEIHWHNRKAEKKISFYNEFQET